MGERMIRGVQFGPEGVDIAYMTDQDVRAGGEIYQTHTIFVTRASSSPDLAAAIADLEEATNDLLAQAIQGWASTLPFDFNQSDEEDDDDDDE